MFTSRSSAYRRSTAFGNEVLVSTTGRHDPGVGLRAVPAGEAMHLSRQWAMCAAGGSTV